MNRMIRQVSWLAKSKSLQKQQADLGANLAVYSSMGLEFTKEAEISVIRVTWTQPVSLQSLS